MKTDTLEKANAIVSEIKARQTLLDNTKNQKVEWIDFTFGNGSSRSVVCNDQQAISQIKDMIELSHLTKIVELKNELEKL